MNAWSGVVGVMLMAGVAREQPPAQQPPRETFRSSREILTIDASVRDPAGKPVTDLKPSDFIVRIDGEPREVLTAHVFGAPPSSPPAVAAPAARFTAVTEMPPGRVVVFAIDRDSIRPGGERAALEAAASILDGLSASDAAGAVGLPGRVIDLTRDHKAVADGIRAMTGTQPIANYQHFVAWDEAVAYERRDALTIARVLDRECTKDRPDPLLRPACPGEVAQQAKDMVFAGRIHADVLLSSLTGILDRLKTVRAPRRLVLMSAGIPFDTELLSRYQALASRAAEAHVALSVIHLDQAPFDVANSSHASEVYGGREYETGLATIASMTGGDFFTGVGRATGVFQRIASDITSFYELGVESRPSDADGKPHRVEVKVGRTGAVVRAPAATAMAPPASRQEEAITRALAEPTDVAELPLAVASYATHSVDSEKVRMIVAAQMGGELNVVPSDWGFVITQGTSVIATSAVHVGAKPPDPWAATVTVDVPPGRYRLRVAAAAVDGRIATLEVPLVAGLRAAGAVQASDVIIGTSDEGRLQPRSELRADERATAMLEMTSSQQLTDTKGVLQLLRGGPTDVVARVPFTFHTRTDDRTIVVAEAPLDLSGLTPGTYTASAVLDRDGSPFMRVSRVFSVLPGAAKPAATAAPATPAAAPAPAAAVDEVMHRVGQYVAGYGEQASLIVGVEHYEQQILSATPGEQTLRRTVAEYALVRTSDATGWVGFRDVIESDARGVGHRRDRLESLFHGGSGDTAEARRIADESARYNLGLRRNFNEPTVALFFLLPKGQSRFSFVRKRETTIDGTAVWEIDYHETARPTLIRTTVGTDVPCEGTIWVVPADGTVIRTRLSLSRFAGPASSSQVEVTYLRDARLGLWLPATMKERHDADMPVTVGTGNLRTTRSTLRRTTVSATATYSDFKRFETSATFKIK
jgi:VWFA-related protein